MNRFVVVSGCSGSGKSTLLAELARRGFAVVEEPGRRIVAQERLNGGAALPWIDLAAFARRAVKMALEDRRQATVLPGTVFFDRGLIDAAVALEHAAGIPAAHTCGAERYHRRVFMTPPWPEIFRNDGDRLHGFDEAVAEYDRLVRGYGQLGYCVESVPRMPVPARADWVLARLDVGDAS
ncbi:AAA family ATPase [Novosphingobium sp. BL-8H]|uniref:AAA family ATPase n=1 Tax=Novosphingobium sp. BL-8H TaxID=3127640 RepID=UPI0037573CE5